MANQDSQIREDIEDVIQRWLNRSDLDDDVPGWFNTAHRELQRLRNYKCMEKTAEETLEAEENSYCLPTDLKKPRLLYSWDSDEEALIRVYNYTDLENIRVGRTVDDNATVVENDFEHLKYTIWSGKALLFPTPSTSLDGKKLRLDYYAWIDPPADSGFDWFTTYCRDYILYRALMEAAPFLGDDPRLETWQTKLLRAEAGIIGMEFDSAEPGELIMRG